MTDVLGRIETMRIVPVVVIRRSEDAAPLAQALVSGGLPGAEVTLRTPEALAAIRVMAEDPAFLVGAGTVVRVEQVAEALAAGARYIVTPGFSAAVVRECQRLDVLVIPGVATATEVQMAVEAGLSVVKFFPAVAAGGVPMIKALSAPFGTLRFVPTGGVGPAELTEFLSLAPVLAVGGSWMVAADLIDNGNFARITQLTAEAVGLARGPAA